jgi:glycolate oxidase FAD binding subunit
MLRSVGAGGGRLPPATRWACDETHVPTATAPSPAPPREITLLLTGLNDAKATELLMEVLSMPTDISAAAHLGGGHSDAPVTALRLEGFQDWVDACATELESRPHKLSDVRRIEAKAVTSGADCATCLPSFAADLNACIWRLMLPGTQAARVVSAMGCEAVCDWGGSEVFIRM